MKQIYWLDRILPSQSLLVGDKAFALSQLMAAGYPILNGFVIGAATIEEFRAAIANGSEILADFPASFSNLDTNDERKLQSLARNSRQEIIKSELNADFLSLIIDAIESLNCNTVILRSSLNVPKTLQQQFTGLLGGVICKRHSQSLSEALKVVWGQLFSARNLFFWQQFKIEIPKLELAILVQPIENAIASGTIEITRDFLEIHSSWGLGHSCLKGEVLPDYYRIVRVKKTIDRQQLGFKMRAYRINKARLEPYLLTEAEQAQYSLDSDYLNVAIETAESLARKDNYLGTLEWTLTNTEVPKFYITQSLRDRNNIFTVAVKSPFMNQDRVLLKALAASPGVAIATVALVTDETDFTAPLSAKTILVAKHISPSWFPLLKQAAGVVAEEGGVTSHAAIIARELGIPAIVGAANAREILANGQLILLDGTKGEISSLSESEQNEQLLNLKDSTPEKGNYPLFNYPIATKLYLNLSQPSSIANAVNLPVDGIGLLRSELMLLDLLAAESLDVWLKPEKKAIFREYITNSIAQFASAFANRPVFYRSLDWRSFELNNYPAKFSYHSLERGTYNYTIAPNFFDLELDILLELQKAGHNNIKLILPFVRSVEEFIFCRDRVEKKGLNREKSFQIWIMAEVPSVFYLLPEYAEAGVKGISIGTNDLTELMLGTNRDSPEIKHKFNANHPAMLKAVKQLIKSAKKLGISCSICGQAPVEYPESIEQLIKWGIDSISVEPQAVKSTYMAIARAEQSLILKASIARLDDE